LAVAYIANRCGKLISSLLAIQLTDCSQVYNVANDLMACPTFRVDDY
jgi:hypothetical protein